MSKKNQPTATIAERKQALEDCIHNLKEIELIVKAFYPRVGTEIPVDLFTSHERTADEFIDYAIDASGRLIALWGIETRKEVSNA